MIEPWQAKEIVRMAHSEMVKRDEDLSPFYLVLKNAGRMLKLSKGNRKAILDDAARATRGKIDRDKAMKLLLGKS